MKKRILSIVLSIVMLVSLLPTTALAMPSHTDHCVCGGSVTAGDHTHDAAASTWKAWNGEDASAFAGGIQVNTGNYYLSGDLTLSGTNTIRISGTVNLCLNGHSITASAINAIGVSSGATLNICDCSEEGLGSISTTGDGSEGDVIYNYYGTVNVYGGSISATGSRGDGIYNIGNDTKGVVNIYGGNLSVETSNLYYGINNQGGIVNVYDGSISALGDSLYGIYSTHSATVSGGTVSGSTSGIHNANADAILIVSGSASIIGGSYGISSYYGNLQLSGNPGITGGSADIRLDGGTNNAPTIGIDGVLANTEKYTVMTYQTPTTENPVVFTSAVDEGNADKFESADSAYQVIYEGGVLKLAVPSATPAHAHDMSVSCGGSGVTYTAWDGTDKDGATDGIQLTEGNWYLTDDVTLTETLTISSGTINLCLNGHSITITNSYDAFYVESGATLNICDCSTNQSGKIENTSASPDYAGIFNRGGTVNVYGGTVSSSNNHGIFNNSGTVNVYSGTVSSSKRYGINNKGTVNVYGGSIGGYLYSIYNDGTGTVNISGGSVDTDINNSGDNSTVNISGGSVEGGTYGIQNGKGTVNITGGTVSGEEGIYNPNGGRVVVSAGSVSGEYIGICNGNTGSTVTVSGGSVTSSSGYGIYNDGGTFNLSGVPTITGNTAGIYLADNQIIAISGALTYTEENAISVKMDSAGTFTSGWTEQMGENADYDSYFTSKNEGYTVQPDGNELKLAEPSPAETHSHPICGATCTHDGGHSTPESWTKLTASNLSNGTLSLTDGNSYYLGEDIAVTKTVTISGTIDLCLNGHVLSGSGNRISTVTIQKNAVLNLCDCGAEATHKIIKGEQQWFLTDEGTDTIHGGVIVGGRGTMSDERGGGICINGGQLNMYAGSIIGGDVGKFGGGVFVTNSGDTNGSFTMYNGTIAGNYAYCYGAGVYVKNGTFRLIDGNITENYAGLGGGGVYVISSSSVFNMSGGSIDSNKANNNGSAGVTVLDGLYNLSGGKVINNKHLWEAAGWGGIYIDGEFKLSGAPEISGNTSTYYDTGGNIFLCDDRVITIEAALSNTTPIGVVMENHTGVFTGGGENYQAKFYSEEGYNVVLDGAGNLMLAEHVHDYTYTVNTENAAQIIESCTCGHEETATVSGPTGTIVYDGTEKKGATVSYSTGWLGGTLTVTYQNNINAGQATASITKAGATASVKFTINKAEPDYTLPMGVTATYGDTLEDIKISDWGSGWSWKEPTTSVGDVGTKTFVAVFKPEDTNNYNTVEAEVSVKVNAKQLTNPTLTLDFSSFTYDGSAKTPTVTVMDGSTTLTEGTDYTVNYSDNTNAGTGKVTVTFTGNYSGSAEKSFTIGKADQKDFAITSEPNGDIAYGGSFTLSTAGGSGGGAVSWAVTTGSQYAEIDENGKVTVGGVGTVTITATKAESTNYKTATDTYTFTSMKATPVLGTVSVSGVVKDTTAPADVELTQTGTVVGAFEITDDAMLANKSTYNWTFTPTDTVNYTTITGTVEIEVADTQAPSATITVDTKEWKEKLNNITFGIFFDNTQTVTITYADNDNGSGIKTVQYLLSDAAITDFTNVSWNTYEGAFSINPDSKVVIYAKVTDNDGNSIIVNSNGIVLDKTAPVLSSITDGETYYGNKTFAVNDALAGVNAVTVDGTAVTLNNGEHTIVADNAQHTIVVTDNAGNATTYTVTVYKIYTVTYKADGQVVSSQSVNHGADATAPAIPTKDGYTQTAPYWNKDGKNITADTEINAEYTINKYTVTFNTNGGGDIEAITGVTHGSEITKPTDPTKGKANFAGWFSDSDCTMVWNFDNDTVTGDLTLYAKWSEVTVFQISGTVKQLTGNSNETTAVRGATVKLMLGDKLIATTTTDGNGNYSFAKQEAGHYNVVVTNGAQTVTVLIELTKDTANEVVLPASVTNSIVDHKPAGNGKNSIAAGTLVGGLEELAAAVREQEEQKITDPNVEIAKVEVTLTVEDTPPVTGTPTAGTEAAKQQAQQKAIQQKAGGKQLVFFDLSVVKTIDNGTPEAITDTGAKLLEIRIPFDSGNKWGITIYRYHDNKAEALAAVREGSTTEGFWVGDDGYIHIYTHKFSTYAVGYTVPSYGYFVPVTPDTVTSADTFDAGIVVYVTMSMLAATGSAVVIGKKRKEEN